MTAEALGRGNEGAAGPRRGLEEETPHDAALEQPQGRGTTRAGRRYLRRLRFLQEAAELVGHAKKELKAYSSTTTTSYYLRLRPNLTSVSCW